MYVAGMKTTWDKDKRERSIKLYCCQSMGLRMAHCNTTKNYTDGDTSLVLQRPRLRRSTYGIKAFDGQIIRDIDHWNINGQLVMRYNVCRVNGSDNKCKIQCWYCTDPATCGVVVVSGL